VKLTALHLPGLCLIGTRIAKTRGFFEAEGLDVELLEGDMSRTHEHTGAWVTGRSGPVRADITTLEYPALVPIAEGSLDYYVVAGEHSGCRQLIVPVNSPIQSIGDLKGKRIALPPVNDRVMWDYLIRQSGTPTESVTWMEVFVPTGGAEEVASVKREFSSGRVDAYVAADPSGEILKEEGVARLLASNTWTAPLNDWYCCMIGVRREIIDQHPEVAGAVSRAYRRSAEAIEQNPAESIDLCIKAGYMSPGTNRTVSAKLLGEYVWTGTGRIKEDLERYFNLLIAAGRLSASASPPDLVKRVYRSGD
jgi:NitT/TauT family transport system substrate-binding protein